MVMTQEGGGERGNKKEKGAEIYDHMYALTCFSMHMSHIHVAA